MYFFPLYCYLQLCVQNFICSTVKTHHSQEISVLKEGKDIHRPELHRYVEVKIENEADEFHLEIMNVIRSTKNVRIKIMNVQRKSGFKIFF